MVLTDGRKVRRDHRAAIFVTEDRRAAIIHVHAVHAVGAGAGRRQRAVENGELTGTDIDQRVAVKRRAVGRAGDLAVAGDRQIAVSVDIEQAGSRGADFLAVHVERDLNGNIDALSELDVLQQDDRVVGRSRRKGFCQRRVVHIADLGLRFDDNERSASLSPGVARRERQRVYFRHDISTLTFVVHIVADLLGSSIGDNEVAAADGDFRSAVRVAAAIHDQRVAGGVGAIAVVYVLSRIAGSRQRTAADAGRAGLDVGRRRTGDRAACNVQIAGGQIHRNIIRRNYCALKDVDIRAGLVSAVGKDCRITSVADSALDVQGRCQDRADAVVAPDHNVTVDREVRIKRQRCSVIRVHAAVDRTVLDRDASRVCGDPLSVSSRILDRIARNGLGAEVERQVLADVLCLTERDILQQDDRVAGRSRVDRLSQRRVVRVADHRSRGTAAVGAVRRVLDLLHEVVLIVVRVCVVLRDVEVRDRAAVLLELCGLVLVVLYKGIGDFAVRQSEARVVLGVLVRVDKQVANLAAVHRTLRLRADPQVGRVLQIAVIRVARAAVAGDRAVVHVQRRPAGHVHTADVGGAGIAAGDLRAVKRQLAAADHDRAGLAVRVDRNAVQRQVAGRADTDHRIAAEAAARLDRVSAADRQRLVDRQGGSKHNVLQQDNLIARVRRCKGRRKGAVVHPVNNRSRRTAAVGAVRRVLDLLHEVVLVSVRVSIVHRNEEILDRAAVLLELCGLVLIVLYECVRYGAILEREARVVLGVLVGVDKQVANLAAVHRTLRLRADPQVGRVLQIAVIRVARAAVAGDRAVVHVQRRPAGHVHTADVGGAGIAAGDLRAVKRQLAAADHDRAGLAVRVDRNAVQRQVAGRADTDHRIAAEAVARLDLVVAADRQRLIDRQGGSKLHILQQDDLITGISRVERSSQRCEVLRILAALLDDRDRVGVHDRVHARMLTIGDLRTGHEAVRAELQRNLLIEVAAGNNDLAVKIGVHRELALEAAVSNADHAAFLSEDRHLSGLDNRVAAVHRDSSRIRPDADAVKVDIDIVDRNGNPGNDSAAGIGEVRAAAAHRDAADRAGAAADLNGLLEMILAGSNVLVRCVAVKGAAHDGEGTAVDADGLTVELLKVDVVQRQIAAVVRSSQNGHEAELVDIVGITELRHRQVLDRDVAALDVEAVDVVVRDLRHAGNIGNSVNRETLDRLAVAVNGQVLVDNNAAGREGDLVIREQFDLIVFFRRVNGVAQGGVIDGRLAAGDARDRVDPLRRQGDVGRDRVGVEVPCRITVVPTGEDEVRLGGIGGHDNLVALGDALLRGSGRAVLRVEAHNAAFLDRVAVRVGHRDVAGRDEARAVAVVTELRVVATEVAARDGDELTGSVRLVDRHALEAFLVLVRLVGQVLISTAADVHVTARERVHAAAVLAVDDHADGGTEVQRRAAAHRDEADAVSNLDVAVSGLHNISAVQQTVPDGDRTGHDVERAAVRALIRRLDGLAAEIDRDGLRNVNASIESINVRKDRHGVAVSRGIHRALQRGKVGDIRAVGDARDRADPLRRQGDVSRDRVGVEVPCRITVVPAAEDEVRLGGIGGLDGLVALGDALRLGSGRAALRVEAHNAAFHDRVAVRVGHRDVAGRDEARAVAVVTELRVVATEVAARDGDELTGSVRLVDRHALEAFLVLVRLVGQVLISTAADVHVTARERVHAAAVPAVDDHADSGTEVQRRAAAHRDEADAVGDREAVLALHSSPAVQQTVPDGDRAGHDVEDAAVGSGIACVELLAAEIDRDGLAGCVDVHAGRKAHVVLQDRHGVAVSRGVHRALQRGKVGDRLAVGDARRRLVVHSLQGEVRSDFRAKVVRGRLAILHPLFELSACLDGRALIVERLAGSNADDVRIGSIVGIDRDLPAVLHAVRAAAVVSRDLAFRAQLGRKLGVERTAGDEVLDFGCILAGVERVALLGVARDTLSVIAGEGTAADRNVVDAIGVVAGVDHKRVAGRIRAIAIELVILRSAGGMQRAAGDRQVGGLKVHRRRAGDRAALDAQ